MTLKCPNSSFSSMRDEAGRVYLSRGEHGYSAHSETRTFVQIAIDAGEG